MKNGTIILTKAGEYKEWYLKFIIWLIVKASGGNYEHTVVIVDGYRYETRHPEGFIKTQGALPRAENRTFLEPIKDLTQPQGEAIKAYFNDRISNNSPYNYAKLFLSLVLYKLRPIFDKLKWVPFQNDRLFGDFCSSAVDEAFKFAGIDLLPDRYEEITTPFDFMKSKLLKEV